MKEVKTRINAACRLLLFCVIPLFGIGCHEKQRAGSVEQLQVVSGGVQCAMPGQRFPKTLRVKALGRPESGGNEMVPAIGVKIVFEPSDGSDIRIEPSSALTDGGGEVQVTVRAGAQIGDQYVRVYPAEAPEKARSVRFVSGIRLLGSRQQTLAGQFLEEPLGVMVADADGKPSVGVPVYFKLGSNPGCSNVAIATPAVVTGNDGIAATQLRTGKKTGIYKIEAEVADPRRNIHVRGLELESMSLNPYTLLVTVLGGLALFVYGMKLMSDGLHMVAGEKMKSILSFFTRNRITAVLAGALVTAVVQSSSATSVLVVGFVNAGLLNLTQSIGIIFGANVGTTVTAQIISFKLDALALPSIIMGLLIVLTSKNRLSKGWGETILGFGFIFFGMTMMGDELKLIGRFPTFINAFKTFDCVPVNGIMPPGPVLGAMCIGLAVTVLLQSSSAAMGIVLALAIGGLIDFWTAVPLLLGTNIGTTITALLAAIPANRRAKQTAIAHLLFNFLGTLMMVILFYVKWGDTGIPVFMYWVDRLTIGDVFADIPQNITRHIAMAHTLFNVTAVVIFLPFIGVFARICNFLVPVHNESELKFRHLEPNLLNTPSVAIEQVISSLQHMVAESWSMVEKALGDNFMRGRAGSRDFVELEKREAKIDRLQAEITEYLVHLTRRELTNPQSEIIPLLMHCTNDAERIADHSENIFDLSRRLRKTGKTLSRDGHGDLNRIWQLLADQAGNVVAALGKNDEKPIAIALRDEHCIDKLVNSFERQHVKRLRKGECDAAVGVIFIEMLAELERIGDHLNNIAERSREIQKHYIELK